MEWHPDPNEAAVLRSPIEFTAGMAPSVSGCRWFRDTEGNDIQHELVGWPNGPTYTLHTQADQTAQRVGKGLRVGIPIIGNLVASLAGTFGTPFGSPALHGKPEDPANEVDDFPVMWAAPGSIARTVPWQMDPSRRPEGYRTHAVVTNRRLVVVGGGDDGDLPEELLWEVPLHLVAQARHMAYSHQEADVKITFQDSSWIRVRTLPFGKNTKLVGLLSGTHRALTSADLTERQRTRLQEFARSLPDGSTPPNIMLLPSGVIHLTSKAPTAQGYATKQLCMDSAGNDAKVQPGDLL